MEPALSIQIVWPLAAEEAIGADFKYIEPAHLFNALLKFVELQNKHLQMMLRDDSIVDIIAKERDAAHDMLAELGIDVPEDSTVIRRALRERLGAGGYEQRGGRTIHRSQAARDVCDAAEQAAKADKRRNWEAVDLLVGLFDDPGPEIANVLAAAGVSYGPQEAETPLIDTYCRDLTALARKGSLTPRGNPKSDPACKVVIDQLLGATQRNVLLIQAEERTPDEVVEMIAVALAGDSFPKAGRNKRLLEVSLDKVANGADSGREIEKRMETLLKQTAGTPNIILWLSSFERYTAAGESKLADMLKERLSAGPPMMASINEGAYNECVSQDREWKTLFHAVWLHNIKAPMQL